MSCNFASKIKLHDMCLYKTDAFFTSTIIQSQSQRWLPYTGSTVNLFTIVSEPNTGHVAVTWLVLKSTDTIIVLTFLSHG